MCGINGIVKFGVGGRLDTEKCLKIVNAMNSAMVHRGKDGHGTYADPQNMCFFGHRRLSIVDHSARSNQPMMSDDGRYVLVFVGEIYNYRELSAQLQKTGVIFKTSGDTEVLLQALILWGGAAFSKLRGMFACAFWDVQEQRLILARDHMGVKSLYWSQIEVDGEPSLIFASEIKGLMGSGIVPLVMSKPGRDLFLRHGSIAAPFTILQDVHALMPGTVLEICEGTITTETFWDVADITTQSEEVGLDEAPSLVRSRLDEVFDLYQSTDCDAGVFLSGGIDSTVVAASLQQRSTTPIYTFSLGFEGSGKLIDEAGDAEATARLLGTRHQMIRINQSIFSDSLDDFIASIDQPSVDGLNTFFISRLTSQAVRVGFTGLGGDELFCGYPFFGQAARMQKMSQKPWSKKMLDILAWGHKKSWVVRSGAYRLSLDCVRYWPASGAQLYAQYRSLPNSDQFQVTPSSITELRDGGSQVYEKIIKIFETEPDILNAVSKAELAWYAANTLLRDTDAAAMYSTLEVRVPFLDHKLIEDVVSLHGSLKYNFGQKGNKPLLVQACRDLIPDHVLNNPKRGFEMPVGKWLAQHFNQKIGADYRSAWAQFVLMRWCQKYGVADLEGAGTMKVCELPINMRKTENR